MDDEEFYNRVPKDAKGDPIFLLLPEWDRKRFEERMSNCEIGWQATRDPRFVAEAITWVTNYRQPVPPWLDVATYAVATGQLTDQHVQRASQRAAHLDRYMVVRDVKRFGYHRRKNRKVVAKFAGDPDPAPEPEYELVQVSSWDEAYERAAEITRTSFETCKKSYKKVRAYLLRHRNLGLYITPKEQKRDC
jgi:hypothetical protein